MLTTVLMCSNTQPTFHIHLNDLEVHLCSYLFNGHTASHVCLTQLQGIEVECIVHVCCICNKCSICFVLAKLNTRLQSAKMYKMLYECYLNWCWFLSLHFQISAKICKRILYLLVSIMLMTLCELAQQSFKMVCLR